MPNAPEFPAQKPGLSSRVFLPRLLLAGVLTGITDGLFATASSYVRNSTPTRTFQGVASTLLGKGAIDGGTEPAVIGVLMHFGVAFGWSCVFLGLYLSYAWLRRRVRTFGGALAVAAVYGPLVWVIMSRVVIPLLIHRRVPITARWWPELIGHFPCVGVPIVFSIRGRGDDHAENRIQPPAKI